MPLAMRAIGLAADGYQIPRRGLAATLGDDSPTFKEREKII
jgi:hypothetical protein